MKCDTCRQELPAFKQGDKVKSPNMTLGVIRIVDQRNRTAHVIDFQTGDMRVTPFELLTRVHGYVHLEREETAAKAVQFAESYGGILRNAF